MVRWFGGSAEPCRTSKFGRYRCRCRFIGRSLNQLIEHIFSLTFFLTFVYVFNTLIWLSFRFPTFYLSFPFKWDHDDVQIWGVSLKNKSQNFSRKKIWETTYKGKKKSFSWCCWNMHEPSDILQIGKGSKMSGPIQMLISTPFDVIKVFFFKYLMKEFFSE